MHLISLNIEGNKHLGRVLPFLEREKADTVCLQEVFEKDARMLAERLGMAWAFSPMLLDRYEKDDPKSLEVFGVAILSRLPMQNIQSRAYWSPSDTLLEFDATDVRTKRRTERHVLLSADVLQEERVYSTATTHFVWTPDGLPDQYQTESVVELLALLSDMPEVILCGDFNAPRGYNDTYEKISSVYEDAIPKHYVSSMNLELHRSGRDPVRAANLAKFMVDYIFLSPGYRAENVRLESDVSDHMAVVGDILAV